jgi:hypothetical protein
MIWLYVAMRRIYVAMSWLYAAMRRPYTGYFTVLSVSRMFCGW